MKSLGRKINKQALRKFQIGDIVIVKHYIYFANGQYLLQGESVKVNQQNINFINMCQSEFRFPQEAI